MLCYVVVVIAVIFLHRLYDVAFLKLHSELFRYTRQMSHPFQMSIFMYIKWIIIFTNNIIKDKDLYSLLVQDIVHLKEIKQFSRIIRSRTSKWKHNKTLIRHINLNTKEIFLQKDLLLEMCVIQRRYYEQII